MGNRPSLGSKSPLVVVLVVKVCLHESRSQAYGKGLEVSTFAPISQASKLVLSNLKKAEDVLVVEVHLAPQDAETNTGAQVEDEVVEEEEEEVAQFGA